MKIKKIGHCCLIIEEAGLRVMTDPGIYSTEQNNAKNIDVVLITHEHGDHLHMESLKTVLANNPKAKVITNNAVGKILVLKFWNMGKASRLVTLRLKDMAKSTRKSLRNMGKFRIQDFLLVENYFIPVMPYTILGKQYRFWPFQLRAHGQTLNNQ